MKSGKIAAVLDMEGSFDLDGDLGVLRQLLPPGPALVPAVRAQLRPERLRRFLLLAAANGTA